MGGGTNASTTPMMASAPSFAPTYAGDPNISSPTQGNIFNTSANAFNRGVDLTSAAAMPGAVNMTMNQYLNPWQNQVIGQTVGRMRDQGLMDLNMIRGQAAQAGAFGGARQGLVEAELMDRYNRNIGETVAGLSQQGFNTAAQLSQQRLQQIMGAGGQLIGAAPVGFNMGQGTIAQQNAAGLQQQALMQQILGQGAQQYDMYANYPQLALGTALSGIQGNPLANATSTTSTMRPGMFNYLSLGAGLGSAYLGGK